MQDGPIWIIDDDADDQDLVKEVGKDLKLSNEFVFIKSAEETLQKLRETPVAPFIMICDINLPKMDGFALREKMLADPSKKMHSVPFIYWSTAASEQQIVRAFELSAHGLFIKEASFTELKNSFTGIITYWRKSKMPSKRDD